MKCPQCGSDNTSDSRFCKTCAAPLARTDTPPGEAERSADQTETMATGNTVTAYVIHKIMASRV